MRSQFLPFSIPSIDEEDIRGVVDVLRSGWITTGPKNAEFEKAFGQYVGAVHAASMTSATAGLHLVLMALGIGPGDEVITSSMTWVSTVNLIELRGATPVFADIDRDTLMITPESVKPLVTPRTKMLIPVHFAGAPVDLDPMRELAGRHSVRLIEDAAHAAGTEYKGWRIGSSGTSIFSFHPIKNMTTGEGGMVCSDDADLIEKVRRYRFHGLSKDAWQRYTRQGSPQLEVTEPGFKYNLTDIQAALGLSQLRKLDERNTRRSELAALYDRHFRDLPEVRPIGRPAYPHKHTHHLYVVLLDIDRVALTRDEFIERLKEHNIGTGIHFRAVHLHEYYREKKGFQRGCLPNTEFVSDRLLSLPFFPAMTEADVSDVIAAIKDVVARARKGKA
jgi:UDP-4-amino-4-deoxy-L-arabinose-oxoglutarate aminotransferase